MKKHGYSRKLVIALLTSVSATAALSACSSTKGLIDGWTNDREGQIVEGGKRVPAMNPQYVAAPQVVTPSNNPVVYERKQAEVRPEVKQDMPKQDAPKRAPAFEESPFDYYDNQGNPVEPKAQAVEEQAKSGEQSAGDNFFTRLFGGSQQDSEVQKLRKEPRKPLLDNQYAPATQPLAPMTDIAPVQPEAVPLAEPVRPIEMKPEPAPYALTEKQPAPQPAFTPAPQIQSQPEQKMLDVSEDPVFVESKPVEAAEDAGTVPPIEVNEARAEPNWFERNFKRLGDQFKADESTEDTSKDEDDAAAENMEYPALASVPQTPDQFAAVKADKDQKMEDMQAEHMQAAQDKFDLYNEPSGVQATVPVEIAQPVQEPKISTPLVAEPVLPKQAEIITSEGEKVELLGHASVASDVKTEGPSVSIESAVTQVAEPVKTQAPVVQDVIADEKSAEAKMDIADEQPQQNRWWEGWRIFSAESKQPEARADVAVESPVVSEPVAEPVVTEQVAPQQLPVPIVQMPEPTEVKAEAKKEEVAPVIQPMIAAPVSEPVQPLAQMPDDTVKAVPQVAESEEAAPQPIEEAKPAAGALPSPQILRDVKMLPPSRYSARARSSDAQAQ
ncbi:MAG: hypothetical protein ACK502_00230 [Alphaproteobacteria bacterium]